MLKYALHTMASSFCYYVHSLSHKYTHNITLRTNVNAIKKTSLNAHPLLHFSVLFSAVGWLSYVLWLTYQVDFSSEFNFQCCWCYLKIVCMCGVFIENTWIFGANFTRSSYAISIVILPIRYNANRKSIVKRADRIFLGNNSIYRWCIRMTWVWAYGGIYPGRRRSGLQQL